jgi:hypothetical protein
MLASPYSIQILSLPLAARASLRLLLKLPIGCRA